MSNITRWEIYGIVLVAFLVIGGGLWEEHRAAQSGIEGMRQTIQSIEEGRQHDQQALQATLAAIAQTKRETVTPAQVIRELPSVIQLPAPISLSSPSPAQSVGAARDNNNPLRQSSGGEQPVATGAFSSAPEGTGATIPAVDLKPLFDRLADCKACDAQVAEDRLTIQQVTAERDAAVKAAKGGSFWTRVKHDAKVIGVTLAIGAAVGYAAHR